MVSSRKWKSVDARDGFAANDAVAQDIERPSLGTRHRRTSSIPKPSPDAPLFRSNHVDRLYSRIPYPTKGGSLYYDILTGEQKWRKVRSREPTPRGGLSNLTTLGEKRRNKEKCPGHPSGAVEGEIESAEEINPFTLVQEGQVVDEECPRTPSTSVMTTFAQHSRSMSVSSQLTFLDCGSDMTELDEWAASDLHSRRSSFENSAMSVDSFVDDHSSKSDIPAFKPLPPTLLLQCIESEKRRSEESRVMDSRLLSASELYGSNAAHIEEKTASRPSTDCQSRSSVYKVGCFRRRPQIPVAESSDDEDCDNESVDSSLTVCLASQTRQKRRSFGGAATRRSNCRALTPCEMHDADLDDFSGLKSSSTHSSPANIPDLLNGETPDEWYRNCAAGRFFSESKAAAKCQKISSDSHQRSNPLTRWFRKTVGASLKTLVVASSVAFVYMFSDQQQNTMEQAIATQNQGSTEQELEFDDCDLEDTSLDLSCLLVSHAPTANGFPSSLLDSMPDASEL